MTVKESLQKSIKILNAKKINSASLDAELLLLHALSRKNKPRSFNSDRSWLYAHNDYKLNKPQENIFFKLIKRREKFEPVAYITGEKDFFGLTFKVNKSTLIPRPETEILVEECLKDIASKINLRLEAQPPSNNKIIIADIGTGSGAIAISIAQVLAQKNISKNYIILATDISSKSLALAKKNATENKVKNKIKFIKSDLLDKIDRKLKIDYLLANLPYLSKKEYTLSSKRYKGLVYEPKNALIAKDKGLALINNLLKKAPLYLAKNAKIFLESDYRQIKAIDGIAKKYLPAHKINIIKDLRGLNRITKIEII